MTVIAAEVTGTAMKNTVEFLVAGIVIIIVGIGDLLVIVVRADITFNIVVTVVLCSWESVQ